jgi:high-affinity iron transporter
MRIFACKSPLKIASNGSNGIAHVIKSRVNEARLRTGIVVAALFVVAILVWQGITAQGAPDRCVPTRAQQSRSSTSGFVFREGLEYILVLAAITASMTGANASSPASRLGAGLAFVASLITWFIAVQIVGSLSDNMNALDLQAATGLPR